MCFSFGRRASDHNITKSPGSLLIDTGIRMNKDKRTFAVFQAPDDTYLARDVEESYPCYIRVFPNSH